MIVTEDKIAMNIVVVPGTNRAGSLSRMLATVVVEHYKDLEQEVDLIDLADMGPEFLEPAAYKEPKPPVTAMVERFLASDGAVFIVPEYNGSYPGVLKLFVDMLPYPEGFEGRPCSFIGLSAGKFQGLRAVEHLQGVTGYRNAFNHPRRTFIGDSYKQFDFESGLLHDADLNERLQLQARDFCRFIARFRHED